MTPTTALHDLLARVEAATGPSKDLDALLYWVLENRRAVATTSSPYQRAPEFTGSIDAALALVDQLLPGRGYELYKTGTPVDAHPYWFVIEPRTREKMKRRPTVPLAILAALLKALAVQAAARKETGL